MSGSDYNDHYSLHASLGIVATAKSYVASVAVFSGMVGSIFRA